MRIIIKTRVNASIEKVKDGFTKDLFLKVNPPFPPVRLVQFDGCEAGDKVVLELNFILFKQYWASDIIEDYTSDIQWYFIDIGKKLPFFLKSWRHVHEVKSVKSGSLIRDDITFSTGLILTDLIMYPLLLLQFLYRKPIYKRIFK
ncbi:hypothetical protein [Ekhidna sp.]|uniref:SRPBCC family protein n=1 Tax=Ekhidna sp. TaxID=2608089 RepID=UPI0032997782